MTAGQYSEFISRLEPFINYGKKAKKIIIIKTNILSNHIFRTKFLPYVIRYDYEKDDLAIYVPTWITSCSDLHRIPLPRDYDCLDNDYLDFIDFVIKRISWTFFNREFRKACELYSNGKCIRGCITSGYTIDKKAVIE